MGGQWERRLKYESNLEKKEMGVLTGILWGPFKTGRKSYNCGFILYCHIHPFSKCATRHYKEK